MGVAAGLASAGQASACAMISPSTNIDTNPPEQAREIYNNSAFIAEAVVVGDDPSAQWLIIKRVYKGGPVYFPLISLTTGLPCGPFIEDGETGVIAVSGLPFPVMDFPGWLSAKQISIMRSEKMIK